MLHISPRSIQIPQCDLFDCDNIIESNDLFSSDEFRMYDFKVRRCARGRAHDWTDCPYAHPGEKARRRDPRTFHYAGAPCPEFKKDGHCDKGDVCEFAHGVFECWLHPMRYRTQACKDGLGCQRRVCFFAHTPEQLRVISPKKSSIDAYDGSPARMMKNSGGRFMESSPKSILAPWVEYEISPPVSPDGSLAVMMRRMNLCAGRNGASFGFNSSPVAPKSTGEGEGESFDGLDVGWISELVK